MKRVRRLLAAVVAVVAAMAVAIPAFATGETYKITVNNDTEGHTYEAYQVFVGDLHEGVLSNVEWGSSVASTGGLDAAAVAERLDEDYVGQDALSVDDLLDMVVLGEEVASVDAKPYEMDGLAPGYYVVKDMDGSVSGNDAYTEYIVKVVGNVTVEPKSDVPEVQKKVDDKADSNADEDAVVWQDSADYDMGDAVPFQLTATLANNVNAYATYKVVFHDTLFAGLTYNQDAKFYIDGVEVVEGFEVACEGTALTFTCNDVKALGAGNQSVVVVEYTATLNDDAVVGSAGNPNVVYLEFSNNPNWEPQVDDEGNPTNPGESPTGNTPQDEVTVFTYKVVVNKVDEAKEALAGAEFKLEKVLADGSKVLVEKLVVEDSVFTWTGLDDGDYVLTEIKAPAGYNMVDPIEFTVAATHDTEADDPQLTALEGGDVFTGNVQTGALSADVENKAGTVLPETGGMGTAILYILGAVLVLGAGAALVVKRRMNASK